MLLPYLACCAAARQFDALSLVKVAAVSLAAALWYKVLPFTPPADLAFLGFLAAIVMTGYFDRVYPVPYPGLQTAILGRMGLFHSSVLVLMLQRRIVETGYGFLPNRREWRIGLTHYLGFLPIAAALVFPLKIVHLAAPAAMWKIAATFLGFLWVVALFEEFIFRGVLQQWLEEWTWSRGAALVLTSLLFGAVHLWFRGFPNWRWALLAAALGWFCGHARNRAGSIRAGVVTHALVVATWRGFFT